jgi:dienelactone hydrolase
MGQSSSQQSTSEPYLAKPSGSCCLKGTIHEGESRGTWETIADVETYISKPAPEKANGNILLYFPDVWGMFPNGLLVMDAFADAGYLVLGLDYFRGVRSGLHGMFRSETNDVAGPCLEASERPPYPKS